MSETATATKPKERPILFSGPMVRAILEGRKTVTRRVPSTEVCVNHDEHHPYAIRDKKALWHTYKTLDEFVERRSPHGSPGNVLWVRETWRPCWWDEDFVDVRLEYKADGEKRDVSPSYEVWNPTSLENLHIAVSNQSWVGDDWKPENVKWRPSIFMPRAACRLKLRITDVRMERLHEITAAQCIAEGIEIERSINTACGEAEAFNKFIELWDGINSARGYSFESNPYVWVVEFERL
ncbi:hypothetical protein N836_31760 [Leptolyngbya sp. Heron Island J]|uniref:hypothetical protein n=1 Tax=Leptolyngbya sp. Heron Island J TaxID=1385935 RepID=UPI0003B9A082|nr:hypothetical protein [Leptolyngbya sp. Heron Island J]ESA38518.1 hypothetical protein N836_31760 [Leptolyngbya sp. Heron Island J]